MSPVVRAIDLGYGNVKFTRGIDGNGDFMFDMFPSFAPLANKSDLGDGVLTQRDTIIVSVRGVDYEVGRDAKIAAGTERSRVLHEDYIEQPQYMALTLGALKLMAEPVIDILVVGLPVSLYERKKSRLQEILTGVHEVDKAGGLVEVKSVVVVPQPLGGMISYARGDGGMGWSEIMHQSCLTVDVGYFTFDWLFTNGVKNVESKSGAYNTGVSKILQAVAHSVGTNLDIPNYDDLDAVDLGLREGSAKIYGKPHDFAIYQEIVNKIAADSVSTMKNRVGDGRDLDRIVIVGGGAFLYGETVKQSYPRNEVAIINNGIYANVMGYLIIGNDKAKKLKNASA